MERCSYARVARHFEFDRNSLEIKERIGHGFSSDVFRAIITRPDGNKEEVAAKKVRRNAVEEADVLRRLDHKNIVAFCGTVPDFEGLDTFILMELAKNKDLYHYLHIERNGPVNPITLRWRWIVQAAWAIEYLHEKNLVHKDIKSPNFLIMESYTLKLGDFGFAKEMHTSQPTHGNGTERWMAPEVVKHRRSRKSDVYSYGVVVHEMQTGDIPFADKDRLEVTVALYNGEKLSIPEDCPLKIKCILERCLESDHKRRTDMKGVLDIIENFDPERYKAGESSSAGEPEIDAVPSEQLMEVEDGSREESTRRSLENMEMDQREPSEASGDRKTFPCICGRCRAMPTEREQKCCGKKPCMSLDPIMTTILDKAKSKTKPQEENNENMDTWRKGARAKAYNQVVKHYFGHMGRRNRKPNPSCIVVMIRDALPDSNGKYTGFKPARMPST